MPLNGKTLRPRPGLGQPHGRPISFSASCLFSKTLNVVRDVVDVAADHLAVLFAHAAREHPDREFLVFGSRRMTYAQVERDAVALGEALALIRRERVTVVHGVPTMFELERQSV